MLSIDLLRTRIRDDHWFARAFGADARVIAAKRSLCERVLESFERSFPSASGRAVAVCFVPGRVEVFGKHTDYAGGHSLLAAVDRGFVCISALNGADQVRMVENDPRFGRCEFALSPFIEPKTGHWSNYPMTMTRRLAGNFSSPAASSAAHTRLEGVDVAFGCDLPIAAGMSGSSALMIMTFFAIALPNRLMERPHFQRNIRDGLDLAMYLACAENGQTFRDLVGGGGVGTFGGSEDHTQILNGKPGVLSLFQFCPTQLRGEIVFPSDLSLAIAYSGVAAEKTGAAMNQYNLASRRARMAVAQYNRVFGANHQLLRDLIDEHGPRIDTKLSLIETALASAVHQPELDLPGRFRQFYEEDRQIIPAAVQALEKREYDSVGKITDRSHELSRIHLRNIIPEIDALQRSARELGAVAASGFGAGFGGSAYAFVRKESEAEFIRAWQDRYARQFPERSATAQFFLAAPSGSAGELFV
jgi:galactokinase